MDNQVIFLVVVGTIGLMSMAFTVVFFVSLYKKRMLENQLQVQEMETNHQRQLLKATLESIEKERDRIGTDLHDSVGAMLSTIKLNLQVSQNQEELGDVITGLNETIGSVRNISHQMMPVVLKKYGLADAVHDLASKVNGIEVAVKEWDEQNFTEYESLMIYRIIQESLNNSIKHAQASSISIDGQSQIDTYSIKISDNGIGFPTSVLENAKGMGLLNIINRAQTINAKVNFSNTPDNGAVIELGIPIVNC